MPNPCALAVMLKAPKAGLVKTRLVPPLTHAEAAGLYGCFIKDTFSTALKVAGADVFAAFAGDETELGGLIPEGASLFPQSGEGLGERMHNVFCSLFNKGYGRAVVIGSDSPDLPVGLIEEAFATLKKADLVLGPAKDGGYYLIALNRPVKALFSDIPWSTNKVLEETLKRAGEHDISVSLLDPWHDIDYPQDLELLKNNPNAPESSAFIKDCGKTS